MAHHPTVTFVLVAVLTAALAAIVQHSAALADGDERVRSSAYQSEPTRLAEGLANPRGIVVAADGTVLVAEAGVGGDGPCFDGPEGEVCFGLSGAVTRIDASGQHRVLVGLPSLAGEGGAFATGPHGIDVLDAGSVVLSIGLGADPAVRDDLLADSGLGALWLGDLASGTASVIADLAAHEADENPDGTLVDSNPYGIITVPAGQAVADAGGNSVLFVHDSGRVETLAVIDPVDAPAPPFLGMDEGATLPMESVPTAVALGADGAYYVGVLTGFPFPVGGASVYRLEPGSTPTVYASGFSTIIDLAFGPDGALYVTNLSVFPFGEVLRVSP